MKKIVLFLICLSGFSLYAEDALLAKIDALLTYPESDFSAEYTIIEDKPGQGQKKTVAIIFRRDEVENATIIITAPDSNKGKGYLQQGAVLKVYDPVSGRFNSTSSRDRFENSNMRLSDFTQSTLRLDYKIISSEASKLGTMDTMTYELEAITDDAPYAKKKIWVGPNDVLLQVEDYSNSGQLMRTMVIPKYKKVGNRLVPTNLILIEALRGKMVDGEFVPEKTVVVVNKPAFKAVPDLYFTEAFLERFSK